jgi:hypothetical protein
VQEGFRRKDDCFLERFLNELISNRSSEEQLFEMEIDYHQFNKEVQRLG